MAEDSERVLAERARPAIGHWRRHRALYAIIALCVAPVLASYIAYYALPPSGRTNYGTLIEPQRPVPPILMTRLDGEPFDLRRLAGQWVLVAVDGSDCDARCEEKLLAMRQQRLMSGKERERVERVWIIPDGEPLSTLLLREYEGTHFVRAPLAPVRDWLLADGAQAGDLERAIFLVDPLSNLMLKWPVPADAQRMKRDLERVLRASSGWLRVDPK